MSSLFPSAATGLGSQSALRDANRARVINALLREGAMTRAQLARRCGVSPATVSTIVKQLEAAGMVGTTPTTSSGRRAESVQLRTDRAVAAGVAFGPDGLRGALFGLDMTMLAEERVRLAPTHTARQAIDAAAKLVGRLVRSQGVGSEAVLGVGLSIPMPIDRRTNTVAPSGHDPRWVGASAESMQRRFPYPVSIDNDANLGALSEVSSGPRRGVQQLVYLLVGDGLGAGLILNGELHYGHVGFTGEIGHNIVESGTVVCQCGNRGCLQMEVSVPRLAGILNRPDDIVTTDELMRRAFAGDKSTLRVIEDAATTIGKALADVANLVSPEVIVVGGPLAALGDLLLEPLARSLHRNAVHIVGDTTTVVTAYWGDLAEVRGAGALVLHTLFNPNDAGLLVS